MNFAKLLGDFAPSGSIIVSGGALPWEAVFSLALSLSFSVIAPLERPAAAILISVDRLACSQPPLSLSALVALSLVVVVPSRGTMSAIVHSPFYSSSRTSAAFSGPSPRPPAFRAAWPYGLQSAASNATTQYHPAWKPPGRLRHLVMPHSSTGHSGWESG